MRWSIPTNTRFGPRNGAKVVAKARVDPEYKKRLLTDATAAIKELGLSGLQGEDMVVVETLRKSTTSSSALCAPVIPGRRSACRRSGDKFPPYRARAAGDPRGVLEELGPNCPNRSRCAFGTRPGARLFGVARASAGTENMTEEQLAGLVTRDSMIGVTKAKTP